MERSLQRGLQEWFDVYSLTRIEERAELQIDGLRESLQHVLEVIEEEVGMLGGSRERIVLGGMSQGMAMGLWSLLGYKNDRDPRQGIKFAAFVGFCGWLPFARDIAAAPDEEKSATARSALEMVAQSPSMSTPVFLCHGTDDAFVDFALGRQAAQTIEGMGMNVQWMEYNAAENDGHWIKEPEGFDAIVSFLKTQTEEAG
jgi:predicted esterase